MKHIRKTAGVAMLSMATIFAGCSSDDNSADTSSGIKMGTAVVEDVPPPSPELQPYVVHDPAPAEVISVSAARNDTENDQDVIVEGRLKDFVRGRAAFTIVDGTIESCLEMHEDMCPTPWDYCCIPPNKLSSNMAIVQIISEEGEPLAGNLQGVNSIDHLSTVVVTGKINKDETDNVTIVANKVYLR